MTEILLSDEKFISTIRASELSKYSRDYISQLCRSGILECKRIAGQWYVNMDSLNKYSPKDFNRKDKHKDSTYEIKINKPSHSIKIGDVRSGSFKYDGDDYIPTHKASELTGYTQDYVGQLARDGEVVAKKIGRKWYVARESLLEHKEEKDNLFRALQAQSSGIESADIKNKSVSQGEATKDFINFNIQYLPEDDKHLIPVTGSKDPVNYPNISENQDNAEFDESVAGNGRFGSIKAPDTVKNGNQAIFTSNRQDRQQHSVYIENKRRTHLLLRTVYASVAISVFFAGAFVVADYLSNTRFVNESFYYLQNGLNSKLERYGELIPGRTLKYSN